MIRENRGDVRGVHPREPAAGGAAARATVAPRSPKCANWRTACARILRNCCLKSRTRESRFRHESPALPADSACCSRCRGCSGLLHSTAPALQLYVLAAAAATPSSCPARARCAAPCRARRCAWRELCQVPALNTDRIALLRPGNRLDYYAGSRWSAPLADLVSDLELAVLREDPDWGAVADDRSTLQRRLSAADLDRSLHGRVRDASRGRR